MLSERRKELLHTLKLFELDEDTVCGITAALKTDQQATEMLEWLVENYQASKTEIILQMVRMTHSKPFVENIYNEFSKKQIDWNLLEKYIISLGDYINHYDEEYEECILSQAYMEHKDGKDNLQLTELFIKHGFDVTANEGRNGVSCLRALCWSSYDKYILKIAEMLLDAGVNASISIKEDEDEGVLSCISWKFGGWNTGEYDSANIFAAYYEMIDRQQKGKLYKGIRAFRDAVGKKVSKIEKMRVLDFEQNERISYLISCGEMQLVICDQVEFMVNPYARENASEVVDVTEEFRSLVGARIKGVRYFNSSLAKLSFDSGHAILVGYCDSKLGTWFELTTNTSTSMPAIGTQVESITLWGDIRHSDSIAFYSENTVVLNTKEYAYGLYSHSSQYGTGTVRAEQFHKKWVSGLSRGIAVNNVTVKHIEYVGEAVKWISLSCDEGFIYIKSDGFAEVAIFMSEVELDRENISNIDYNSKGLKKIKFFQKRSK